MNVLGWRSVVHPEIQNLVKYHGIYTTLGQGRPSLPLIYPEIHILYIECSF